MNFIKKNPFVDISEVIESNVNMPVDEFLKEVRDPYVKGLKEAAELVRFMIKKDPGIHVHCVGDYDVDGVAATSIIDWTFQKLEHPISLRIPRRLSEGYGLSENIIDEIPSGSLLITVDNGIAACNAVKKAKDKGITVIIIDHHLPPVDEKTKRFLIPPADVIIDPHIDAESEFKDYCGAALAYRFAKEMLPGLQLKPLLVLASLATVTDVMPLVGANRTLVKDGLSFANAGIGVPGFKSLIEQKKLEYLTEDDYGFMLGPIFNASGRLYDDGGSKSVELLHSKYTNPALPWMAKDMIETNDKRKKMVKESMIIAESLVTDARPIVIHHASFHEGIVGIIAGRLAEKYNTPCVVFTTTESGIYKGSARSAGGIHLKAGLDKMQEYMIGYGGHAGAAGIAILPEKFQEFSDAFIKNIGNPECFKLGNVFYDLDITEHEIASMVEELKTYAPYGEGNPKISFRITLDVSKGRYMTMGDGSHFSIDMGGYKVLGFGMSAKYNELERPARIEAICHLSESCRDNVSTPQVELIDFQKA